MWLMLCRVGLPLNRAIPKGKRRQERAYGQTFRANGGRSGRMGRLSGQTEAGAGVWADFPGKRRQERA
jgi:hypothetical protein